LSDGVCFADADERKHNTLFMGLPIMSMAQSLEKFPNADIYVMLGFPIKYTVFGWLTEQCGIDSSRILNYEPIEKYASCEYLQGYLCLQNDLFGFCFNNFGRNSGLSMDIDENLQNNLNNFIRLRDEMLLAVRNKENSSVCAGCRNIQTRHWPVNRNVKFLNFEDFNGCNLKCSYCSVSKPLNNKSNRTSKFSYSELIDALADTGQIDEDFRCIVFPGEIAVHPRRNEILSTVELYPNVIYTNAVVFNKKVAQILTMGKSYVYVSVDAGTRGTYNRIKGFDLYEKVCGNLKKYSEYGAVELKYIVLPEVNDNDVDAGGFVQLCKDVKAKMVMISRDYHGWSNISDTQLNFTVDLYLKLCGEGILASVPAWQYSNTENKRLDTEIVKRGGIRH
jgi:sulfatase maturation enzyme AslB (radical SAM superfamily)